MREGGGLMGARGCSGGGRYGKMGEEHGRTRGGTRRRVTVCWEVLFPICAMAPRKRLKAFVLRTSCCSSKEEYDLFSAPRSNDFFSPQRNRHQLITTICTKPPKPCLGQGHTRALHYLHDSRDVFRGGDFATECRASTSWTTSNQ